MYFWSAQKKKNMEHWFSTAAIRFYLSFFQVIYTERDWIKSLSSGPYSWTKQNSQPLSMEPAEYGMAWFLAFHHYKEGEKKK